MLHWSLIHMNALFSMMEHAQDETIHLRFRLSSPAHLCWYGGLGSCHKQLVASRNAQVHIDVILPVGFWRFSLRRPAGILAGFVHMSSFRKQDSLPTCSSFRVFLSSPAHLCWYGSHGPCHKQIVASLDAPVHNGGRLPWLAQRLNL